MSCLTLKYHLVSLLIKHVLTLHVQHGSMQLSRDHNYLPLYKQITRTSLSFTGSFVQWLGRYLVTVVIRVRLPYEPLPLNERGLLSTMNEDFQDMADTAENYYQQCDTWRDRSDALGDELDGVFE